MRILSIDDDKSIDNIILYLKLDEAKELMDSLSDIIQNKDFNSHAHINDLDFSHEVTITLYDESNTSMLDERSKKIIESDM